MPVGLVVGVVQCCRCVLLEGPCQQLLGAVQLKVKKPEPRWQPTTWPPQEQQLRLGLVVTTWPVPVRQHLRQQCLLQHRIHLKH